MNKLFTTLLLVAAITSVTAMLSPTSVFAPTNNAQDDKNNPTFPGCAARGDCHSDQAQSNTDSNCFRHEFGIVGNGQNLPAQCY
jgi:hypothetical protein